MDKPQEPKLRKGEVERIVWFEHEGANYHVPDVLARHVDELSEATLRAATHAILWATNDEARKCDLSPCSKCVLLRELLRVYRVLIQDTQEALQLLGATRKGKLQPFSLTCRVDPANAYKISSRCADSDEEREKLIARVKAVESNLGISPPPFLARLCAVLATGKRPDSHLILCFLALEEMPSLSRLFSDRDKRQTRVSENIEALGFLVSAVRALVRGRVDTWLAPLLRRKPGVWTSGLLRTLGDSLEFLVSWDLALASGSLQEAEKDAFSEALEQAINYTATMEDLDFGNVPDATSAETNQSNRARTLRIRADIEACNVWLDETPFLVPRRSAIYLQAIIDNEQKPGRTPISGAAIHAQYKDFPKNKVSDYRNELPKQIRALIRTTAQGSILLPDAWTT